ncbi:hypothetical protein NA56DRAFT_703963 [Hyaloscypha hepaticicola]|uniref:Uncharacterized protein n=1 Tax=Hyaloscypha hepaticicola TaxID=2082293 RepID=A0A2J6Q4V0_9HELO|nr:hypothetical protein NA56DRAFT_703963 [Hyaloscypha hepaticicola]
MVKRPESNDVEFDPMAAVQSLTLVDPSTTRPFSETIIHTPRRRSCAPSTSLNISAREQGASTLVGHQIASHRRQTHNPALLQPRPHRSRALPKGSLKNYEQDHTIKTASFSSRDTESGTPFAANANARGDPNISLLPASPSQLKHPPQRDSMTNGTGSGAMLPESATKFSAHGAILAKDVIKAEGFDGRNEDHDMNGLTQTEFDTERKDTHEEGEGAL